MNKKIIISSVLILMLSACNKTSEKPTVTIAQYSKQVVVMNGVVTKILNEPDPKKMYTMADSIESSRAVACIPVGEECNSYYKLINKIVNFTKEGNLTNDQRMELFKMYNEFQKDIREGEKKIREIWKDQIKASSGEPTPASP